jgi:hypothetical protein
MATTSNKKSRADQYREILRGRGVRLEDCQILAFNFGRDAALFHFCLMADKRAFYYLFDGAGKRAYVITSKPEYAKTIQEIAEGCGGIRVEPDMR